MHLNGRYNLTPEFLVTRGTSVVHDDALVAEVAGCPSTRIHAHVAHCTADHDLLDLMTVQNSFEFRFAERVDVVLEHDWLTIEAFCLVVDLSTERARRKERRVRGRELMPHVNDQVSN